MLWMKVKAVSDFISGATNNDTPFMNPSSHLHSSANQQQRSSLQREVKLKLSHQNAPWPLPTFPSFLESTEHQTCWMRSYYWLATTTLVQEDGTSVSRSHAMDSWRWNSPFTNFLSDNSLTNTQAWSVGTHSLCLGGNSRAGEGCPSSPGPNCPWNGKTGPNIILLSHLPALSNLVSMCI